MIYAIFEKIPVPYDMGKQNPNESVLANIKSRLFLVMVNKGLLIQCLIKLFVVQSIIL